MILLSAVWLSPVSARSFDWSYDFDFTAPHDYCFNVITGSAPHIVDGGGTIIGSGLDFTDNDPGVTWGQFVGNMSFFQDVTPSEVRIDFSGADDETPNPIPFVFSANVDIF